MEELTTRYSGLPTVKQSYMTEFVVECPKCKHAALVTAGNPWFLNNGKLTCEHCKHSEKADDLVRYKVSVKRNCDNCGQEILKVIPNSKEKVETIAVPCPHCGVMRNYKPRNEEFSVSYHEPGNGLDPIFHLPLWLQGDVRGNLFWAYNRLHLYEIKQYVQSKLRERRTPERTTRHTTMVERLPNFIKEAKNRESVLKAIDKIERKHF
jgi:DNA-directed RNA polymerase subunit RPC12/RpoP